MRVLHALHTSLPHVCGYSIRSDRILSIQKAHGVDVLAVTSAQQPDARNDEQVNGIPHYRTTCPRLRRSPIRELQLIQVLSKRLSAILDEAGPDIVHAHSPVLVGLPAYFAAAQRRIPFVYEVRDLWENASVDRGKFAEGSIQYRAAQALETWLLRRADAVITIGETLGRELERRAGRSIAVAPNGVDPHFFAPLDLDEETRRKWVPAGRRLIAYVGAFQPYEGLHLLVRAMRSIVARRDGVHLLIAGDGPERAGLADLVSREGLERHVTFTGRLSHADVKQVYGAADLMVYPRLSTRTTQLTTPLKPLEALSMERAVLASDLPAIRELIADGVTGVLFTPGDTASLVERALALLSDTAERVKLGKNGRAAVLQARRWESCLSTYDPIYLDLLPARASRTASVVA